LQTAQIIAGCKKGHRDAQEALYRAYARVLFSICLKYSRNQAEAEDSLHDSFMIIYEKIGQYKSKGSFEGWLKRVTLNTVLQKYRKETYLNLVNEDIRQDSPEVEDLDDTNLNLGILLQHIQSLPNKYRATFNLYVLDGYSHKEIAEMMGTSVGTSKSNLARARMLLKEKLIKDKVNFLRASQ
jgi:RNA polymerase sigma-70 factor (ECF subfamily)